MEWQIASGAFRCSKVDLRHSSSLVETPCTENSSSTHSCTLCQQTRAAAFSMQSSNLAAVNLSSPNAESDRLAMAHSFEKQVLWEPAVANTATRRAQQQWLNADVYEDVPLHGSGLPPVTITMTTEAYYALGRAIEFSRLRCQPTCGTIDEVFELGLAPLEREGIIPTANIRNQYLNGCRDFIDRFDTTADESIEHAHLLSFDFGTLNLDAVLVRLRIWAICAGKGHVYQLGIITNMLGCYDMKLFNSVPSKPPTHTIFFVRHCLWDRTVGKFLQLWEPLVQATDNVRTATVAGPEVRHPQVSGMPPIQESIWQNDAPAGDEFACKVADYGCRPPHPLSYPKSSGGFQIFPKSDAQHENTVLSPLATSPAGQVSFASTPTHPYFARPMGRNRSVEEAIMDGGRSVAEKSTSGALESSAGTTPQTTRYGSSHALLREGSASFK
ncbi:hypothetical protein CERZMDRAFT_88205 [Cercospora zeae-maydis SCOH1-5]|uniref:Uncharacterized protein n=1 Tax=Cercospora zeae-maydis SCOH1-5 TaxID=717836 RepID=A0A6A6F5Z0_9PEZI|nr:hypothetical protein CERZMDRAFT_88205 [Cercospora zeae-maydis SCOH1-5]